jgi:hypothetical protein
MQNRSITELITELKNLRIREARVIALIEIANARHEDGDTEHGFAQGDRIKIKNQVKRPTNWGDDHWDYRQARVATVTQVTRHRVYFVTDNGVNTWRAPHNVELL